MKKKKKNVRGLERIGHREGIEGGHVCDCSGWIYLTECRRYPVGFLKEENKNEKCGYYQIRYSSHAIVNSALWLRWIMDGGRVF